METSSDDASAAAVEESSTRPQWHRPPQSQQQAARVRISEGRVGRSGRPWPLESPVRSEAMQALQEDRRVRCRVLRAACNFRYIGKVPMGNAETGLEAAASQRNQVTAVEEPGVVADVIGSEADDADFCMLNDEERAVVQSGRAACAVAEDGRSVSRERREGPGSKEVYLEDQERQSRAEEAWLAEQAENQYLKAMEKEAEEFDEEEALLNWTSAQHEALARVEADTRSAFEEEQERELQELASAENAERHHLMRVLQKGAEYLLTDEVEETSSYEELVAVQYAAQRLKKLVERGMHAIRERDRQEALFQRGEALRLQAVCEAATAERLIQNAESTRMKQEMDSLRLELEQNKDRLICRICYSRPRDAVALPCMHMDYCTQCLKQHQNWRNKCPTCRCSISGVLTYTLSLG